MTHPHFSRTQLRRAVLSSYLGSVIEYYDFLLYATASAEPWTGAGADGSL